MSYQSRHTRTPGLAYQAREDARLGHMAHKLEHRVQSDAFAYRMNRGFEPSASGHYGHNYQDDFDRGVALIRGALFEHGDPASGSVRLRPTAHGKSRAQIQKDVHDLNIEYDARLALLTGADYAEGVRSKLRSALDYSPQGPDAGYGVVYPEQSPPLENYYDDNGSFHPSPESKGLVSSALSSVSTAARSVARKAADYWRGEQKHDEDDDFRKGGRQARRRRTTQF